MHDAVMPFQTTPRPSLPSKYSPFQTALRLSNLPPSVRPAHLTHILSHPASHGGLMGRARDPGVGLIQVMSEPRKLRKSRMRFKAFRTFSLPLLEPKTPPPLTASEKPLRAGHLDLTASTTRHDESEGEAPEHFVPIVAERHDSESLHHGTSPDEGESTATVAYIHFRNEWDRAFPVLHSIEPNHADETGPLVASTR